MAQAEFGSPCFRLAMFFVNGSLSLIGRMEAEDLDPSLPEPNSAVLNDKKGTTKTQSMS